MSTKTLIIVVSLVTVAFLLGGALGGFALADDSPTIAPAAPAAALSNDLNYQGRLTDASGQPLSGTFPMRFQLRDTASGGTPLWDSGTANVAVTDGLFNKPLDVPQDLFNGQALWLAINVDGAWLAPRQELLPAAYALSLRPGATIAGEPNLVGRVLQVELLGFQPSSVAFDAYNATGSAVRGESDGGVAVSAHTTDGYAVYGYDGGINDAHGYGGYFQSSNGIGVYGKSDASIHHQNTHMPGVYGESSEGVGVYGVSEGDKSYSYGGYFEGRSGIYARSSGTSPTSDYAGYFVGSSRRGLYAISLESYYDAYFAGDLGIYTAGGYHSSQPSRLLAQNAGPDPLSPGDVVSMAGVTTGPDGQSPLLQVTLATPENAAAVSGVVASAASMTDVQPPANEGPTAPDVSPTDGPSPAGGYLFLVTDGLVAGVRAGGTLTIGDLVTVGPEPGTIARSANAAPGTVLGKVAGPPDPATGLVPVFVTLR